MTGGTVAYSGSAVNTLCRVEAIDPQARVRLRALIDEHYPRRSGGIRKLSSESGITEEVIHSWFRATGSEPSLGSLAKLGKAMGMTRTQVIARMDGVDAPQTEEAAPSVTERLDLVYALLRLTAQKVNVDSRLVQEIEAARQDVLTQSHGGRRRGAPRRTASSRPQDG